MATTKETTIKKKPAAKKATTTKKVSASKRPTHKAARSKRQGTFQSFQVSGDNSPFLTYRITRQTLYWLILAVVVFFLGAWVLRLEVEIQGIYDSIDRNNISISSLEVPVNKQ